MASIGPRDYLRANGYPSIGSRGRYTRDMLQTLADAGFDVKVPPAKDKPAKTEPAICSGDPAPEPQGWTARPTPDLPKMRDESVAYAINQDGLAIAFGGCGRCHTTLTRCTCETPKPREFYYKLKTKSGDDPIYTISWTLPED